MALTDRTKTTLWSALWAAVTAIGTALPALLTFVTAKKSSDLALEDLLVLYSVFWPDLVIAAASLGLLFYAFAHGASIFAASRRSLAKWRQLLSRPNRWRRIDVLQFSVGAFSIAIASLILLLQLQALVQSKANYWHRLAPLDYTSRQLVTARTMMETYDFAGASHAYSAVGAYLGTDENDSGRDSEALATRRIQMIRNIAAIYNDAAAAAAKIEYSDGFRPASLDLRLLAASLKPRERDSRIKLERYAAQEKTAELEYGRLAIACHKGSNSAREVAAANAADLFVEPELKRHLRKRYAFAEFACELVRTGAISPGSIRQVWHLADIEKIKVYNEAVTPGDPQCLVDPEKGMRAVSLFGIMPETALREAITDSAKAEVAEAQGIFIDYDINAYGMSLYDCKSL